MDASTTFRPDGTSVTQASGGPLPVNPGVAGPGQIDPAFVAMLRKIAAARQAPSAPSGMSTYNHPQAVPSHAVQGSESPYDPLRSAKIAAQAAQLQAISGTAPQRLTTFASGAINGYTPDPSVMTGAQRAAFLPNNAGQQGDFGQAEEVGRNDIYEKWAKENAKREPYLHGSTAPGQLSTTGY